MMSTVFLSAAALLLGWAAICDIRTYRIPNVIPIALVVLFAAYGLFHVSTIGWGQHVLAGGLVLAFGALAFHFGLFGGGDVKLWAAAALWVGLDHLSLQLTYIALIGSGLAFLLLASRYAWMALARTEPDASPRILQHGQPVPYGVAIAFGSIASLGL